MTLHSYYNLTRNGTIWVTLGHNRLMYDKSRAVCVMSISSSRGFVVISTKAFMKLANMGTEITEVW